MCSSDLDEVRLFVLNCDQDDEVELSIELQNYGNKKVKKHLILANDDLNLQNTIDMPGHVKMKETDVESETKVMLPKLSWNVIILG